MPDDPTTPVPTAPVPAPPATPAAPADPAATVDPANPDEPLREPGKKALDAERTRAANAEKALADLRKEIEDSKKSAEQKAADDLKAAQNEAAANAAKALKYEVAAEHGIPLSLAARLTGTTLAEIQADAENFKTQLPAGATPPAPPRIPGPDPTQGPTPPAAKTEADQIYEALYPSAPTT
jgi:hypothetical protein